MNEDYVSYELAVKLKARGFDEPCHYHYDSDRESHIIEPNYTANDGEDCQYITADDLLEDNNAWQYCSAPTLWQAQKWLREKKKIDVLVYNCACGYLWEVSKAMNGTGLILFDEKGDDENSGCWTSYEAALSAGISAALEMIITPSPDSRL